MNGAVAISTSLAVTTGDGDDAVSLDRLTASAITVHTNDGTDKVTVNAVTASSASFDLGNAGGVNQDSITVGSATVAVSVTAGLSITTGDGNDLVTLDNITGASNVSIITGGAVTGDTVLVGANAAVNVTNALTIASGGGVDILHVDPVTAGTMNIDSGNAGAGNADAIQLGDLAQVVINGKLSVTTGDGSDAVNLVDVTAGSIAVKAGAGADFVSLETISAGSASVDTGSAGLGSGETVLVGNATDHVALTAGLAVTTGDGNDGVFINNLTADHINVSTGTAAANASDTVTIGNLAGLGVTGLVSIATVGRGFVTLDKLSAGSVDVHYGSGALTRL